MVEQLEHFQFSKDFDRTINLPLFLEELPKIVLGENDGPSDLAKGHLLLRPAGPDAQVPLLEIKFVLGYQPIAQMVIDFVHPLFSSLQQEHACTRLWPPNSGLDPEGARPRQKSCFR